MRVLANSANGNNRRACFVFLTHKLNVVNLNNLNGNVIPSSEF